MKTSVDDSGNNTDDDMNMAHRLESGGSGGGIRGEVDKGMRYDKPFILFYSSWKKTITAYMEYMMDKKATRKLTILYNKDLKPENQEATATETRDQQRYGPGSGVGA